MKNPRPRLKLSSLLATACLALATNTFAVDPPPDGGYPNNNTAEGDNALFSLTTGFDNTATGNTALGSNTTGSDNTATGSGALDSNTTGDDNTAIGKSALHSNTTGEVNVAIGGGALYSNDGGSNNTATGVNALYSNTTGESNTANGNGALFGNTTGTNNTAIGLSALTSNTTGINNTATGTEALTTNTTGMQNTATGFQALKLNTTGLANTANGYQALVNNTTGIQNTASGYESLSDSATGINNSAHGYHALNRNTTGINNTANGASALMNNTRGSNNIAVGFSAGSNILTSNNNIEIANVGAVSDSGYIRIGKVGTHRNTFIAGINGVTVAGGVGVIVDSSGHLGTVVSSARFKDTIKPMDKASEAILSLRPVTFHYKKELDPAGIPQFGLVAEQVEKVNPALVARDDQGKPYTVRYEAVNAMLLNEFLKEHRRVEEQARMNQEQEVTITDLKSTVAKQQQEIHALNVAFKARAAQIQKVSDSASAPHVVANN